MSKSLRPALLLFVLLLAACGFHPLYDQHSHGDDALAMVQISRLEDRTGQQFNWLLQDRFYGGQAQGTPVWKLDVHLTTEKQELGIRRDSVATRARLTMNATFTLTPLNGQGETLRGSERSFVSYNIFTNPYATRTAEDNATRRGMEELADLVTNRIALYLAGQTRTKTP
jgi:LPS-assembly lipoprotein